MIDDHTEHHLTIILLSLLIRFSTIDHFLDYSNKFLGFERYFSTKKNLFGKFISSLLTLIQTILFKIYQLSEIYIQNCRYQQVLMDRLKFLTPPKADVLYEQPLKYSLVKLVKKGDINAFDGISKDHVYMCSLQ